MQLILVVNATLPASELAERQEWDSFFPDGCAVPLKIRQARTGR